MISLLITMFLACGDKEEEQDTAVDVEETIEETEETEEGSEEGEE